MMARPTTAAGWGSVIWVIVLAAALLGAYVLLLLYG